MIDWEDGKVFVPPGTLRVILSWVIASLSPCTQRTKPKRWGYLYSRSAAPSYFNFTECNKAENQHWGQRGCGNHNSACAKGLQVFPILSIIARSSFEIKILTFSVDLSWWNSSKIWKSFLIKSQIRLRLRLIHKKSQTIALLEFDNSLMLWLILV